MHACSGQRTFQDEGLLESLCLTSRWDARTFIPDLEGSASARRFSAEDSQRKTYELP
jgi:hypothetical protein